MTEKKPKIPLDDKSIKAAKPKDKPYKLSDSRGMFLMVHPNGSKYFRFRYSFDGKDKTLALGTYPDISLRQARERREDARKLVANGVDPVEKRRQTKTDRLRSLANSFELVSLEWGSKYSTNFEAQNKGILTRHIFPALGGKPINDISRSDLLSTLNVICDAGHVRTSHKALQICTRIFRYALIGSRVESDITVGLGKLLPERPKTTHYRAATEPAELAQITKAIDGYTGTVIVKSALQLIPLLFVRSAELINAKWSDINFESKEWRYTATKTNTQMVVPLANQAIQILSNIKQVTGHGTYVFPNIKTPDGSRPMSSSTMIKAMRSLGLDVSVHGFRASLRTIGDEVLMIRPDLLEHQLGHRTKNPNGNAYIRTTHLKERCVMMQQWSDYLDEIKSK